MSSTEGEAGVVDADGRGVLRAAHRCRERGKPLAGAPPSPARAKSRCDSDSARVVSVSCVSVSAESVTLRYNIGALGSLLAVAGVRLIRALGPADLPRLNEVNLDLRVLRLGAGDFASDRNRRWLGQR